mmetsp:Transcript_5949/g.22581  ORF Transcript_5949/g.22581 Transcript_5949/m.22581 type:complete len:595 (+) Transcript_5949:739-2523(+)
MSPSPTMHRPNLNTPHSGGANLLKESTTEQSFQLISNLFRILEGLKEKKSSQHYEENNIQDDLQLDKLHHTIALLRAFFTISTEKDSVASLGCASLVLIQEKHSIFIYFVNQCFIKYKSRIVEHCDLWVNVLRMISSVVLDNNWMQIDWEKHSREGVALSQRNVNLMKGKHNTMSRKSVEESDGSHSKEQLTLSSDDSSEDYVEEGTSSVPATNFVSHADHNERVVFLRQIVETDVVDLRSTGTPPPLDTGVSTEIAHPQLNFRYTDASSLLEYQSVVWIRLKESIPYRLSTHMRPYAERNFFHTLHKSIESLLESLQDIVTSLCVSQSSTQDSSLTNRELCLKHTLIFIFTLQHMFDTSNFLYSFFVELSLLECFDVFLTWMKYHINFTEDPSIPFGGLSELKIHCCQLMGRIMLRLIENHELALSRFVDYDGVKILRRKLLKCSHEPLLRVLASLFRYTKRYQQQGNGSHSRRTMQVVGVAYRLSNLALRFTPDSWLQGDYVNLADEHSHQLVCQRQWKKLVEYIQKEEDAFETRNEMFLPLSDELDDDDASERADDSGDEEDFPLWEIEKLKASVVLKPRRAMYVSLGGSD